MDIEGCFYLGYTSKVHGKHGELIVKLDVDSPEGYKKLESVFVRMQKTDNLLVPFFMESTVLQNNGALRLKIADVNSADQAKAMVGKEVYLPLEKLPKLTGNKFYFHEVVDFEVKDVNLGGVGRIIKVLDYPTQAVMEVKHVSGKEILIPITDEVVVNLDRKLNVMEVKTPEGLVAIYLES